MHLAFVIHTNTSRVENGRAVAPLMIRKFPHPVSCFTRYRYVNLGRSRVNVKHIAFVFERWPVIVASGSHAVLFTSPLCPALATGAAVSTDQMATDPSEYPAVTVTHSVASAVLRQFQREDLQNLQI
jgi:hypothetical protein